MTVLGLSRPMPIALPCPQCAHRYEQEQTLAGHLMDAHGLDAPAAAARAAHMAREIGRTQRNQQRQMRGAPDQAEPEEEPMSAAKGKCTYCQRPPDNHSPRCARVKRGEVPAGADRLRAGPQAPRAKKKKRAATRRDPVKKADGLSAIREAIALRRTQLQALEAALTALEG